MSITLDLNENEKTLVENYAKLNSLSVEQALKATLLELIEDKIDLITAEQAHDELMQDPVTYSHDDAWAEIMGD